MSTPASSCRRCSARTATSPFPPPTGWKRWIFWDKKHIDLILLDIMMPRMDGYEFTEIIRGNQMLRDIPILDGHRPGNPRR